MYCFMPEQYMQLLKTIIKQKNSIHIILTIIVFDGWMSGMTDSNLENPQSHHHLSQRNFI